ncbi:MAG: ABC transporter permease [Armatimonadetes bacterium]|nr:ABC transporter permease [Armatimonadota bacterium]
MTGDIGVSMVLLLAARQACPLVIASMGGILSERSGVVNIALEGMMLTGAFVGLWAGQSIGLAGGFGCALLAGASVGAAHLFLTQRLRLNHIVSGVALNILALNASTFFMRVLFNQADPPRQARLDGAIPLGWFLAFALIAPLVLHFVLYHTVVGLRLRACGESSEKTRLAGVSPAGLRALGVIGSGVLAAAAGAYLSMSMVGRFTDDMVSGRGFIALAAVICGRWTPIGAGVTCCAFGLFDALQLQFQGTVALPSEAMRALPYILTIVAAVVFRSDPPADLGADPPED